MARLIFLAGAAGLAAASALEDTSVLLQAHAASEQTGMLGGRMAAFHAMASEAEQLPGFQLPHLPTVKELAVQLASSQPMVPSKYNCTRFPWMCEAPFNCHHDHDPKKMALRPFELAEGGHANLRTWCMDSTAQYTSTLVKHCLRDKDLKKSGEEVYKATVRGRFGPMTAEMDGSYCFIEGHCSNTAVTENTTLEEAEQMCDFRYGHDGWTTNFGMKDIMGSKAVKFAAIGGVDMLNGGFYHTEMTRGFLKAACAMGNYHCDVMYCRETYCKKEYYIKKYGHLLPKVPGHLIQQKDWVE